MVIGFFLPWSSHLEDQDSTSEMTFIELVPVVFSLKKQLSNELKNGKILCNESFIGHCYL